MWTMPVPSSRETSSQGMTRCSTPLRAGEVVERALVAEPDELAAAGALEEGRLRVAGDRHPLALPPEPVLGVGIDGRGHVGRQRPRGRRPDGEGLARPVEEREAHEERGVDAVLVVADELVCRDRRAAARAPLRGAVPQVEMTLVVHAAQEAPDVLDVRVREGEVVVAPVHPLAEPLRSPGQLGGRPDDLLPALARELGEAVLLDLPLRVEPELALDADLDPEPLAVEPVLVALVEAAQGLVALEDVLERAAPGGVDGERLVRGDGPVHEAPAGTAPVQLPEALERPVLLPPVEDLQLERGMVGHAGQRPEHFRLSLRL
jgi:hypothetical protein